MQGNEVGVNTDLWLTFKMPRKQIETIYTYLGSEKMGYKQDY